MPNAEIKTTACPLDCPDSCSLEAHVEDGRLVALDGSQRSPLTAGFLCSKVRAFGDYLYADERVRTPLVRTGPKGSAEPGGGFREASWDEARFHAAHPGIPASHRTSWLSVCGRLESGYCISKYADTG